MKAAGYKNVMKSTEGMLWGWPIGILWTVLTSDTDTSVIILAWSALLAATWFVHMGARQLYREERWDDNVLRTVQEGRNGDRDLITDLLELDDSAGPVVIPFPTDVSGGGGDDATAGERGPSTQKASPQTDGDHK